jgi:transketolase
MRKTCMNQIYALAKKDKRVLFVGSDIGAGTLDAFKKEMPDRFFMEGVSEQNIVGMMAGFAMNGAIVYFNTLAIFTTRRCYEHILIDVAMHNLPVRFIGSGGGFVYAPLGPTHMAFDDIALMRTIPGMTVVAPADATEMERLMPQTLDYPGPIYIRLAKGGDPIVTPSSQPFRIGRGIVVQEGSDVLFVTTGITLKIALEASSELKKINISGTVLHMPTIKPLDAHALIRHAKGKKLLVTIEEAKVSGGLGTEVIERLAESGHLRHLQVKRIGIPDVFPDKYGSQNNLMDYYGISTKNTVRIVKQLWKIRK